MQFTTPPILESGYIGFDDVHPPELLPRGIFKKADNVLLSDEKISKVTGSTAVAASIAAKPFDGLATYENPAAATKYLIAEVEGASNSQWYSWSGSGAFSVISGAGNSFTNGKRWRFATANKIIFGFSSGYEQGDWDGTTFTKGRAGVPLGLYPAWFHNYLFVASTASLESELYWSDLGNPVSFTGANHVSINPGDGDQCMGLGSLQDELFYFKKNTIWSITGWSGASFSATTIATQNTNNRISGYGCVAPDSILSTGNDVYYLSFLGQVPHIRSLRKTQFASTLAGGIISYDIATTMGTINKSAVANTVALYDGRYCYWAVPTGSSTTPNKILVLDTYNIRRAKGGVVTYPWTTMTGKNVSFFTLSTISGSALPYFSDTSATSGLVFKFDSSVYTDNGNNISIDLRKDYMRDPARKNKWGYLYIRYDTGSSNSLNINATTDFAANYSLQKALSLAGTSPGLGPTGTFTLGVSTLGGNTATKSRVTFQHLVGTVLNLQFTETSANAVGIYEHEIYSIPKGLRSN